MQAGLETCKPFILDNINMPDHEWQWADEIAGAPLTGPHYSTSLSEDEDQVWGIVFTLPNKEGFQAAWSYGEQSESGLSEQIHTTVIDAAAHAVELAKAEAARAIAAEDFGEQAPATRDKPEQQGQSMLTRNLNVARESATQLLAQVNGIDQRLDEKELPPTGDDYNKLFGLVRTGLNDLLEALKALDAENWLDADPCDSEGLAAAKAQARSALANSRKE
ncbi:MULTISPECIES: hypothetical protein [Pseudomonas]|jgi:hypothetical protein|uniref:hypothetical protein n=1 Tax=Pseudomonas TaxID=286 RepID=UPI0018E903DA|nr:MULTISPECIES: hypothetical protein [Pseudomonas]MBJ2214105.1 hypothetical protein [Pseudomonas carnis]MBP5947973.1 hypothetical protein [Pseudomonas sp. P9(2020)]